MFGENWDTRVYSEFLGNFCEIFGNFLQDSRTMIGSGNRIVRKKLEEM